MFSKIAFEFSDALGQSLSADELETAMKIIDSDGSGVIEFDEFVEWWVNKVSAVVTKYKHCVDWR